MKTSKKVALYHKSDVDGVCCGSILKKFGWKVHGMEYGDVLPAGIGLKNVGFIADFSLAPEQMSELESDCVWIDHHRVELEGDFNGVRLEVQDGSACLGVFRFFYDASMVPGNITFMSQWDHFGDKTAWVHNLGWFSEWGLRLFDTAELFDDHNYYQKRGSVVRAYLHELWSRPFGEPIGRAGWLKWGEIGGFECDYIPDGRSILAAVKPRRGSGGFKVSLRAKTSCREYVNCRDIARQFGGGGHPAAAGFIIDRVEQLGEVL